MHDSATIFQLAWARPRKKSWNPASLTELQPVADSLDVAAIPVHDQTPACVDIRWSKDNETFTIDLSKFLMLRPIDRPRRTVLRLPAQRGPINGMDDALIFQFSKAYIRPMAEGTKHAKAPKK